MVLLALSINSFENYFQNKLKKLLKINFMKNDGVMQKNDLNECSTCRCWKNNYAESKVSLLKTSSTNGESGLCVGGGFDGSQTKSNETCSMWKPLIDKERISPIFYPRESGE
jgi:hypothetical protein